MAKLTRKSYKRKKIAFAAVILGGVALVSSGFAAWVLSANATKEESGVTTVGKVKDNSLSMSTELQYKKPGSEEWEKPTSDDGQDITIGTFDFDPTYEDVRKTGQRVYNDGKNFERLTLRYVVTIKSKDAESFDKLNVKMEEKLTENETSKIDAAVKKNYVIAPTCFSSTGLDIKGTDSQFEPGQTGTSDADKLYTWTINYDVSFKWGSFFSTNEKGNGMNPGDFFETEKGKTYPLGTVNDELPTNNTVSAILNDLHAILDNASYKLTFTASAK